VRIFIGAASLPPTALPPTPSLPHMQRSALGCGPPILLLGAQACVGWAGGAARPSRIAPTPWWCPPVRLRMGRRLYPTSVRGLVADSCDRARALRPPNCCPPPPVPRGRACTARIAPTCAVLPPSVREVGRSPYFCNGFWPAPGPLCPTRPLRLTSAANAPASVTRTRLRLSDRANVHRAAARIAVRPSVAQLL
jgi:hypothetical protein